MCRWLWASINSWPVLSANIAGCPSDSRLSSLSSADEGSCRFWSACVRDLCLALLQLGLMLAFFDFWGSMSVVWRTSTECSASAGMTCLPQALGVAGSERAPGTGGYSNYRKILLPFSLPLLFHRAMKLLRTHLLHHCCIWMAMQHTWRNIISNMQDDSSLWASW